MDPHLDALLVALAITAAWAVLIQILRVAEWLVGNP